jgi:hypothetical protein
MFVTATDVHPRLASPDISYSIPVHGNDLPRDQEIEEHPDRSQMLLHGRRGSRMVLDVSGDDDGGNLGKGSHAVLLAPREELADGLGIGSACVPVPDRRREDSINRQARGLARAVDRSRQVFKASSREIP